MNFPDLAVSSAGELNQALIFPGHKLSARRANSPSLGFPKQPKRFRHQINPTVRDLCTQIPGVAWSIPADMECHCTGSHPGSSQRASAFCTRCTAPTSTCSITHSLGQGFGLGNFSGLLKCHFLRSSDKFFPQVKAQGETCSSGLALLIAKARGAHVPQTPSRQMVHPCTGHFSEAESLSGATLQC